MLDTSHFFSVVHEMLLRAVQVISDSLLEFGDFMLFLAKNKIKMKVFVLFIYDKYNSLLKNEHKPKYFFAKGVQVIHGFLLTNKLDDATNDVGRCLLFYLTRLRNVAHLEMEILKVAFRKQMRTYVIYVGIDLEVNKN